ncbi:MAG: antibiotic biosynthesis monooxygenase [Marmoricola sp.]|nr:antibiotic biosynthesis monooxygenase [Marmoricola sp.]
MSELQVIARYTVAKENAEKVLELISSLVEASRTEPGCLAFDAYRRVDDDTKIVLLERYTSRADFDAHRETEHFKSLVLEQIVPLLESRTFEAYDVAES